MAKSFLLKSGALAAMAASLSIAALPIEAVAQDHGWSHSDADAQRTRSHGDTTDNRARKNGSDQSSTTQDARPRDDGRRAWNEGRRSWNGRQAGVETANQADGTVNQQQGYPDHSTSGYRQRRWDSSGEKHVRNETYADPDRNRTYSDPARNRSYQDRRDEDRNEYRDRRGDWRDSDRHGWRDNDRNEWRDRWRDSHDRDNRRWDRDWRHDQRYDWRNYRNTHRYDYRLGRYYAPYWNYHYRRLSIGFYLDTLFFSSRYWIADPWAYRLPPAYGPYRWVRYYDDALLVDIYSGEVVDVIYDFFW